MKCSWLIILFLLFAHTGLANMFDYTQVDFFNDQLLSVDIKNLPEELVPQPNPSDQWGEPIVTPTGGVQYYQPPEQVVNFLENPSEETAKVYLKWNTERINKLLKAQAVLNAYIHKSFESPLVGQKRPPKLHIYVFLMKGCPYCLKQQKTLKNLLQQGLKANITVFLRGYDQTEIQKEAYVQKIDGGVSDSLGINTFPTTLIYKNGKKQLFSGFLDERQLVHVIQGGAL